ncbi:MAG: hypothetical protein A2W00_15635 [Candidatus Eisenbacteria bacterium RBG_16_71_46]|nr:MAG: hypothetical protein A2W00_15635 [Candidatus Eisenbacteria bacterium RBG_16_71_46]
MRSPADAHWSEIGDGVLVRQSRAFWMNSGLLLDPEHAIVVDPGVLPSELDELRRVVRESRAREVTLFLTHAHWDHVLGRPWFPRARIVAHDRFAAEVRRERADIAREAADLATRHGEAWRAPFAPFAADEPMSGLRFARYGPWRAVFREAPGHSSSQLTLHLPDRGILFAADMLSDLEMPLLDGPVAPYRATLRDLAPLVEQGAIETVVPGHGAVAYGAGAARGRLERDLDYLDRLEAGAREARRAGLTLEQARERLAAMDYTGKDAAEWPTNGSHLENVAFAFEGAG